MYGLSEKWGDNDMTQPVVAYVRVSTSKQGKSGLGVEAQREAIARFAEAEGLVVASAYVEVETGKGADALDLRPQLRLALDRAHKLRCPIVVAKLDRLSRDVAFIAGLMGQRGTEGRTHAVLPMAMIAAGVKAPIAIIGPLVDLAVDDPVRLTGRLRLLRGGAKAGHETDDKRPRTKRPVPRVQVCESTADAAPRRARHGPATHVLRS
jgi:hypothetical protein